jgi:hypothetical protein
LQGAVGSYRGHLIGTVFTSGNQYVAAGGLPATYQFAKQMGRFAVSGSAPPTGSKYAFGINSSQGLPITGAVNGSFYDSAAANTGGNFNFHTTAGPTCLTSGIFAAKR